MNMEERFEELLQDAIDFLKTGFREPRKAAFTQGEDGGAAGSTAAMAGIAAAAGAGAVQVENPPESVQPEAGTSGAVAGGNGGYDTGIDEDIRRCTKCRLHEQRRNAVPGAGSGSADIMFIGEGPGEQEDIQGLPFVGKAGQLLTRMLASINLKREEVYITNIVKCRPPENRNPLPDEVSQCLPFLERQIEMIRPLIIVCLGGPASKTIIKTETGITRLRGKIHHYMEIPVIPTYHPAAVLRFPERYKRDVWNDLKLLRDLYKDLRA